jgi:hypothetical protein
MELTKEELVYAFSLPFDRFILSSILVARASPPVIPLFPGSGQRCRAGKLPYSLHRTTFDDALAHGLYHRICEATRIG